MIILIGYELDDEIYNRIVDQDMHAEELYEEILEEAVEQDFRHHVWHFPDEAETDMDESLSAVFDRYSAPKTRELIDRDK